MRNVFENKKIFILGMAKSGYEAAKLLAQHQNQVFITDRKEQDVQQVQELEQAHVVVEVLEHPEEKLDESYQVVVKNPGIRMDHPVVIKAKELQIPVVNEMEVAYHFLPKDITILGVTGSNGKTTTTTLLYEMLKEEGKRVHLGGNIGYPLCSLLPQIQAGDSLVLEISDHQLMDLHDFKTNISILTNLSEVHLDFHGSYEHYKQTKKKIFAHHTAKDVAILNQGNQDVMELTNDIPSKKITFSAKVPADCQLVEGKLLYQDQILLSIDDIKLQGKHNIENCMCAILAALQVGVSKESICQVLTHFGGVEHRLEYVRTVNGVDYYNDSKATNVESTIIALSSFERPTILLLGGLDRGHSFEPLNEYVGQVKQIVAFGETKDRIAIWAKEQSLPCIITNTLEEAMRKVGSVAVSGDVVLLSPACASWDQYQRFEDRGDEFKAFVQKI